MASTTMFSPVPLATAPNRSLDGISRYLFRVSDPDSSGATSGTEVRSPILVNSSQKGVDLYQMKPETAATYLNSHLQWKCQQTSCNLMSWTSSLLFALQYALYRHKGRRDVQDLSSITILVVDTRQFPRGVFARDLDAMKALQGLSTGWGSLDSLYKIRSSKQNYGGEYLSQGKIFIDPKMSCQISIQELIDHGLFDICPGLGDKQHWTEWANRVEELRRLITGSTTTIVASDVQSIVRVANVFARLALPMTIMFLGIIARSLECSLAPVLERISREFPERNLSNALWSLGRNQFWDSEPPEVQRSLSLTVRLEGMRTLRINDSMLRGHERNPSKEPDDGVDELAGAIHRMNVKKGDDNCKLDQKTLSSDGEPSAGTISPKTSSTFCCRT